MKNPRRWGHRVIWVVAFMFLMLDTYLWVARPSGVALAWGRILFGIFFQLISLSLLSLLDVSVERSPASQALVRRLISILVPCFVFGWIGSDLVHKGIYQGEEPMKYRGQR